jgi:hypothetical protein
VLVDGIPYVAESDGTWKTADGKYTAPSSTMERWQRLGKVSEGTPAHDSASAVVEADTGVRGKHSGEAVQQAAELMETNRQYVAGAKAVKEADPELHEQVKAGRVKLREATVKVKGKKLSRKAEKQARAQEEQERKLRREIAAALRGLDDGTRRVLGDHEATRSLAVVQLFNTRSPEERLAYAKLIVAGEAKDVHDSRSRLLQMGVQLIVNPDACALDLLGRFFPKLTAKLHKAPSANP